MKIAFTATGGTWDSMIDPRLGRTGFIVLYNEDTRELTAFDNSAVKNESHGAGAATAQKLFELKPDVLITGNGPGNTASTALKRLDMRIFINASNITLAEAYKLYQDGRLEEFLDPE